MNGVTTLYDRWQELLKTTNTSQNDEFKWTTNQLRTGIKSIEWDLQDLEETIVIQHNNNTIINATNNYNIYYGNAMLDL